MMATFSPKTRQHGLWGGCFLLGLCFFRAGPWGTPSPRGPQPMGYPSWARFLEHLLNDFWLVSRPNLTYVSGCSAGWAGGVTRSAKNYLKSITGSSSNFTPQGLVFRPPWVVNFPFRYMAVSRFLCVPMNRSVGDSSAAFAARPNQPTPRLWRARTLNASIKLRCFYT